MFSYNSRKLRGDKYFLYSFNYNIMSLHLYESRDLPLDPFLHYFDSQHGRESSKPFDPHHKQPKSFGDHSHKRRGRSRRNRQWHWREICESKILQQFKNSFIKGNSTIGLLASNQLQVYWYVKTSLQGTKIMQQNINTKNVTRGN